MAWAEGLGLACRLGRCFCTSCRGLHRRPAPPNTLRVPPRASESKSFYSMPKQKRSPFGNRFRFGRACAVKSELKPDFSRSAKVIVFVPFL